IDSNTPTSPWLIGYPAAVRAGQRMIGHNNYEPRAGITTWADGIYFGTLGPRLADGTVTWTNTPERAKGRKPRKLPMPIETDYIFPFIEWKDIQPFRARPTSHVLIPQDPATRRGFDERQLARNHPKT